MDRQRFACYRLLIGAALALALGTTVGAQVILGSIGGSITDGSGAALPGVTVTLTSPALQVTQVVKISGDRGEYQVTELPAGLYRVTYELTGFTTLVRDEIRLTTGFAARLDVVLQIATLAESVTVTGQSPLVDMSNTRGGITVSKELLQSTPNSGVMQDLFLMSGGVRNTSAPVNGEAGVKAVATVATQIVFGQSLYNITQQTLDGVLTFSNQMPDFASVDEIVVRPYGNTSEVGAPGVSTVFVVKSGSNEFHTRIKESYQDQRWQANNIDDHLRSQGISVGRRVKYLNDFSGDLGGRIVRDKLWFYGAFHRIANEMYLPGFSLDRGPDGIWSTTDDTPALNASRVRSETIKGSLQATQNHRFIGLFTKNTNFEDGTSGTLFVPHESSLLYRGPYPTLKGEWQGTLSRIFVSTIVGYHSVNNIRDPQPCCDTQVSTFDLFTQQQTGAAWTGTLGWRKTSRRQVSTTASYVPAGSFLGSHQFSAGVTLLPERFEVDFPVTKEGDYRLVYNNGAPAQFWTRNGPAKGLSSQNQYAAYLSDSWRVTGRLTLNAGLRWDRITAAIPAQVKQSGPWPFTGNGAFPAVKVQDRQGLAPRVGTAFDLFGDGKTVVKATYGLYNHDHEYAWVGQFNPNGNGSPGEARYRWSDPTGCRCYAPGAINLEPNGPDILSLTGSSSTIVNPDLKLVRTHEATGSVEREFRGSFSVRALYVYKREVNGLGSTAASTSINTLRPYSVWNVPVTTRDPGPDGRAGTTDDGELIIFYDYDPAYRGARFVATKVVNAPDDRSNSYNALQLMLEKRASGGWFATTSFTVIANHRWIAPVVDTPNADLFPLDETTTWSYRLAGGYELPYGILLSTSTQVDNGTKGQRTVIFASPSSGTMTVRVEPFGRSNGPTVAIVNGQVQKRFRLRSKHEASVELNAFNLFNSNAPFSQSFLSGPSFGKPTEVAGISGLPESRAVRFGVSFAF